jgi:hypothetical protein
MNFLDYSGCSYRNAGFRSSRCTLMTALGNDAEGFLLDTLRHSPHDSSVKSFFSIFPDIAIGMSDSEVVDAP